MNVDTGAPVATRVRDGLTFYFCSLRCAEEFDRGDTAMRPDESGDAVDPVCAMRVNSLLAPSAKGVDHVTYYFCSPGCRATFLKESSNPPGSSPITLGPKP
jgi:YHS domain-containing protein